MEALRTHAGEHAAEAFRPHYPPTAHQHLDDAAYIAAARRMQSGFRDDPGTAARFRGLFAALGLDPNEGFWDRFHLRVVPPGDPRWERPVRSLPPHRDCWGSNLYQQINWWAPVFEISEGRTLELYPGHWHAPVANTSPFWDLDELKQARRGGPTTYPHLPVALGPPDRAGALRPVPAPGELLCFSGAHLHATVENRTDHARFSLETRTVHLDDLISGRRAPNIDGAAQSVAPHWFRGMATDTPLALEPTHII